MSVGLGAYLTGCAPAPDRDAGKVTARVPIKIPDRASRPAVVDPAIAAAINRVNRHRGRHGRGRVTLHARLNKAALGHARAMANRDFFSHNGPDGSTMGQRVTQTGYIWGLVAENIAAGQQNPMEAIRTWMDSPGHRRNILMKGVVHIGLAHFRRDPDPGEVSFKDYWVMVLAKPIK
jgi:uncharacterized protein YkwD